MKVILQQDVKGQGKKGQMIEASDGYARNFLLPRKLAVPATAENVNTMKMQEKAKKAQEAAEKAEAAVYQEAAQEMSKKLKKMDFDFNDYLTSLEQMNKMGGISSILNLSLIHI